MSQGFANVHKGKCTECFAGLEPVGWCCRIPAPVKMWILVPAGNRSCHRPAGGCGAFLLQGSSGNCLQTVILYWLWYNPSFTYGRQRGEDNHNYLLSNPVQIDGDLKFLLVHRVNVDPVPCTPSRGFSWLQPEGPTGESGLKTLLGKTSIYNSKQGNEIMKATALQVLISAGKMSKRWKAMYVSLTWVPDKGRSRDWARSRVTLL